MRQTDRTAATPARPLVGIAVEGVTAYGRSVLRGVVRYANLQRKWVLHKDLWRTVDATSHWPACDGTIIAGVSAAVYHDVVKHSRLVVGCSGSYDPRQFPVVALDDEATGAMAAEHLIDCGLPHFACYGPNAATRRGSGRHAAAFDRRARAFTDTLAARGHACIASGLRQPSYHELLTHSHHPALIDWVRGLPKPVGIFAADDMMAHDLAEACREADVGVPEQVAILGVNNDDLLCESAWPPLSSIEADFARMGYLAAKMLDRLLGGETLSADERWVRLPPVRVQQRMSTSVSAVGNAEVAEAVHFIREHACDPCSIKDVLRVVPLARRSLERQFQQQLGRSPYDEINRVRMDAARRLLVQPDLSIADVADRCGFSAIQSFNRFFVRSAGLTPAVFRRQRRSGA